MHPEDKYRAKICKVNTSLLQARTGSPTISAWGAPDSISSATHARMVYGIPGGQGWVVCVCVHVLVHTPSQGTQKHITHTTQIRPKAEKYIEPTCRKYIRVGTRQKVQYPNYRKRGGALSTEMVRENGGNDHQTQREKKADSSKNFNVSQKSRGKTPQQKGTLTYKTNFGRHAADDGTFAVVDAANAKCRKCQTETKWC